MNQADLEQVFIQTNGIRLHAVQAGPEDGKLTILLHGFPEFWYGWRRQINPLAQAGYRVLVPDQRGYNLSDKPRGIASYRMEQLTGDVLGLIEASGREKASLVGHDWGAAVAWETALRYPERVEKLAILNVPHLDIMQQFLLSNGEQRRKSWYIFFFQVPWVPERTLRRKDFANIRRMLRGSGRSGTFSEAEIDEYAKAWGQPGALTAMIHWYRAAFRSGLRETWKMKQSAPRRVQVPTLMLWGKRDVALSAYMAQPSIELCDQGRLVYYEEATHWVQHDEAQAVSEQLLMFLSE